MSSKARTNYIFTSESVSEGHPDKVCDQISDLILDLHLRANPHARVAIETLATTNLVVVAGETRDADSVTPEIVDAAIREHLKKIGYEQEGFHWKTVEIRNYIHRSGEEAGG